MSITPGSASPSEDPPSVTWRLDPARSSVEFRVRHFYGLMTIKGQFGRFDGALTLGPQTMVHLTVEAESLDTGMAKRDTHLRSADFFDAAEHPQVRFVSDSATLDGETLRAHGELHAAGRQVPIDVVATVRQVDDEMEIESTAQVDQRELGMTWSPLGITRAPSTVVISGRLIRADGQPS
jgi:polyisoprenoid-binding protein YceI